jgi:hypothetical protein
MEQRLSNRIVGLGITAGLLTVGAAGFLTLPREAQATPGSNFNTTQLALALFEEIDVKVPNSDSHHKVEIRTKEFSDVYFNSIRVPPGGYSGWHTHPGPSLVAVTQGVASVYDGDDPGCKAVLYPAGKGFVDSGGGHVHNVRNEGTVELLEVVVQIIPAGATRRIDAPNPGNCPF